MPRVRTRTVSTKVSEDDYALLKQLAGDQRVGEWVREILFKAVLSERTAEAHRTILGELLALRKINRDRCKTGWPGDMGSLLS